VEVLASWYYNKHKQIGPKVTATPSGFLKGKQQWDVGINLRPLNIDRVGSNTKLKKSICFGNVKRKHLFGKHF
jgi:hypothetical protein